MSIKTLKASEVKFTIKDVLKKHALNFTDISNNNNKSYLIELQEDVNGKYAIYTSYGRTGGSFCQEYRMCDGLASAEVEVEKIVKSKIKKGYVEVKLVQVAIGSDIAKSKIETSSVTEDTAKKLGYKIQEEIKSSLHPEIQSVVRSWFGSLEQFIIDTIDTSKCALGQLSLEQINKGRDLLLDARKIVLAGARDVTELNAITSKYYSNIPMNFGYRRLDADKLRFDTNDKLDTAFDILDTLEGAKDAEKVLTKKSAVDEQYKSLKTEMEWLDPSDPMWKWIDTLFHKTRAPNHSFLGKMKINNVFKLIKNNEYENYINFVEKMAKQDQIRKELPDMLHRIWKDRVKENAEYEVLMEKANILPLFHGTRSINFPKILASKKLLMRKPGFTVAGSMYDKNGGIYTGFSSKACNYSSVAGSYWSGGSDKKGYLFVSDVALGKQTIARGAYPYTLEGIKPSMSIWAKGGFSGVINDEFIVLTENQNWLKYIIEFEAQVK